MSLERIECHTKALFTRDILEHNIAIKKIFLSHRFQYPTKASSEKNVMYLELKAYLGQKKPVAQNYLLIAISFHRNIFLSQYLFIAILCAKNCVCGGPKLVNIGCSRRRKTKIII